MLDVAFENLLFVALIAVLAPLVLGFAPRLRMPAVVLEIVAGIAVGPSGLGWVEADLSVEILSVIGLAFLLFLAGLEIDVRMLRGRQLRLALVGFAASIGLGVLAGLGFAAVDWVHDPLLFAVALSATSLGLVVPILKDSGRLGSDTGHTVIVASTVAEFGAVILLSLLFSAQDDIDAGARVVLLAGFAALIVVIAIAVGLARRSMRLGDVVLRLQDTTAEIRVRAAVVLLIAFTVLAERFGLESILGAFIAGAILGVVDRDSTSHPHFRTKLHAIGYGFFIPVFFITSGLTLDLSGLVENPSALLRVPLFLLALLAVRGLPALLYAPRLGRASALAGGLLQATSLPFIVAATQIGVATGLMTSVTAAALTTAGLLSVVLFPIGALSLLRRNTPETSNTESSA